MKPYYQDDLTVIYNADCGDLLPLLPKVDLVVTDPPYGIGKDGQRYSTGKHGGRKAYDFLGWDKTRPSMNMFGAILSKSNNQIIWGGNYFADLLPATAGWIVWDKGQRINQSDGELAWSSFNAALRIWTINRVQLLIDGAEHPTQKPLKLIQRCFLYADEQAEALIQTVLDPFMGSGTTLVAAKQLGRKAIGIEIEERYCEIAARRCEQPVQESLFAGVVAREPITQEGLFAMAATGEYQPAG